MNEIIQNGMFVYDAGEHRELACQWFEANPAQKPEHLIIPNGFECDILLGVHDNYEVYDIGLNFQGAQWRNNSGLDSTSCNNVNCFEFGDADMKAKT